MRIKCREYETAVRSSGKERTTFCDVCGKEHKENHGIKLEYDFTDTCGAGTWNVCADCEQEVIDKLKGLILTLNPEQERR